MKFGLVGPSYTSQSLTADCESLINWYVEKIEGAGQNDAALYPCAGLKTFVDLSGLAVRATIEVAGGKRGFAIAGTTFYEVLANGTFVSRGPVINDSQPVKYFGESSVELAFASGGQLYVYNLNANTLTPINPSVFSGAQVARVHYMAGFFVAIIADSNQFYLSKVFDATTWDPGQTTKVQNLVGNIIGSEVSHNELWLFGSENTVVYDNTGAFPFPFEVNQSADIEQGIAAENSVSLLDNTLFWIGSDARGIGVVWSARGYNPLRVSNHAVEFAIQGYGDISDAIAYSFQDQGHAFYQIRFPAADKTWVYDVATGMWHERGYWDLTNSAYTAHRSQTHMFVFGKHLVGDWKSGKIYEMAIPVYSGGVWLFADDDGNPIRRERRAPHTSNEQRRQTYSRLQVLLETGLGPIPPLPGTEAPTIYNLADANGIIWAVSIDDVGSINTTIASFGGPQTIFLNDIDTNTTSWQLTVDTIGVLTFTKVAYSALYPQIINLSSGAVRWGLQTDVNGVLETTFVENVSRAPQLIVNWSNDGGHTFRNEHFVDCGKAGEFKARANIRRLGQARDRVFKIACSDPIPWRVVDGLLA